MRGKWKDKKWHFYLQTAMLSKAKLTPSYSTSLCRTEFCHSKEETSGLLHFDPRMALKGRGAGWYRQGRAFQVPLLPQMGLAALEETHWC